MDGSTYTLSFPDKTYFTRGWMRSKPEAIAAQLAVFPFLSSEEDCSGCLACCRLTHQVGSDPVLMDFLNQQMWGKRLMNFGRYKISKFLYVENK